MPPEQLIVGLSQMFPQQPRDVLVRILQVWSCSLNTEPQKVIHFIAHWLRIAKTAMEILSQSYKYKLFRDLSLPHTPFRTLSLAFPCPSLREELHNLHGTIFHSGTFLQTLHDD